MNIIFRAARIGTLTLAFLLSACATTGNEAFREGMQNMSQGRFEEGLARLEQARKQEPGNLEYRATLARQRDIAVSQLLSQAEAARVNNDLTQAQAIYQRVLGIEAGNGRA
ncbi:MAG: type and secretion system protein, partial [Betaproteobacteria bacterium]|nr:type and secretion system protein [Betaproteobacteria bacterium]